ncbi:MAG: fibronectin type III domain-containing protein, partial [Rubrivivax sp.]
MTKISALALAASLCSLSAMAIEGPAAFVPSQVGATYPDTATAVTGWKLVGSLGASAVQIAPRWALTARHVNAKAGQTFTNAYGSATVSAVIPASNVDLALVYLSSEIPVPANELPLLLSDLLNASNNNLPGQMLAAGRGGFGAVKAHWLPANEDSSIAALVSGVFAVAGDSGSGVFWYPSATSRPVLRSITLNPGNPLSPLQVLVGKGIPTSPSDPRAWIDSTIAGYGAGAGAPPQWTTSLEKAPLAARVPNLPQSPAVVSTSPNGAFLTWSPPVPAAAGVPQPTSYVVRLSPSGAEYNVAINQTVLTIQGLATNTSYTASVAAVNTNGVSGRRTARPEPDRSSNQSSTVFQTSAAPLALTGLTYEAYTAVINGQVKGCVQFKPTYAPSGPVATSLGVSNYQFAKPHTLLPLGSPVDHCLLQPGVSSSFFVAPWNRLTAGPAQLINIAPPAAVSGVPLNLVTTGMVVDGDYLLHTKWTTPNPPQPTAT